MRFRWRRHWPVCEKCGGEINPLKYDGCEKYYRTDDGTVCEECFLAESMDWVKLNLADFAELTGVDVVTLN